MGLVGLAPRVFPQHRYIRTVTKLSLDTTLSCSTSVVGNGPPNTETRKQPRLSLYRDPMLCPLLGLSQLEPEPLSGHKDPRPQDIKTFLCTDCLLTITSLSQLSVTGTSQPLAWELLIRGARPRMLLLPATTQVLAVLCLLQHTDGAQGASLGLLSKLPLTWREVLSSWTFTPSFRFVSHDYDIL